MIHYIYKGICLSLLFVLPSTLAAQHEAWLDSVEANNTTLRALRAQVEAEKEMNRAEIRLSDPEAEVAYKLGTPGASPKAVNVSVSQSFDWGVISGRRRKLARSSDALSESTYRKNRQTVLAEAEQVWVQMVYANRLCAELNRRLAEAEEISRLYSRKYDEGDASLIELNKVKLNTSVARSAASRAESERRQWAEQLRGLNGGREWVCRDTVYPAESQEDWASLWNTIATTHPAVTATQAAVRQRIDQVKLDKVQTLPVFSLGFIGEYVKGSNFNGVTLGVSLPLWGNSRKKYRQSVTALQAQRYEENDVLVQLESQVRREYETARTLRRTAGDLAQELAGVDNAMLLRRSLDEGQISLLDYLLELSFYYDARTSLLEAERDAELAAAALRAHLR